MFHHSKVLSTYHKQDKLHLPKKGDAPSLCLFLADEISSVEGDTEKSANGVKLGLSQNLLSESPLFGVAILLKALPGGLVRSAIFSLSGLLIYLLSSVPDMSIFRFSFRTGVGATIGFGGGISVDVVVSGKFVGPE